MNEYKRLVLELTKDYTLDEDFDLESLHQYICQCKELLDNELSFPTIKAFKCLVCGDIIYARCHHDMVYCSCKASFVDADDGSMFVNDYTHNGYYVRVAGSPEPCEVEFPEFSSVKEAKEALYIDKNTRENKYGRVINGEN